MHSLPAITRIRMYRPIVNQLIDKMIAVGSLNQYDTTRYNAYNRLLDEAIAEQVSAARVSIQNRISRRGDNDLMGGTRRQSRKKHTKKRMSKKK
jgi:hypothetical protein